MASPHEVNIGSFGQEGYSGIVAIGGGHGGPFAFETVLRAGVQKVEGIGPPFDYEGSTKRQRLDARGKDANGNVTEGVIAYSDLKRMYYSGVARPEDHDNLRRNEKRLDAYVRGDIDDQDIADIPQTTRALHFLKGILFDRNEKEQDLGHDYLDRRFDPKRGFVRLERDTKNIGLEVNGIVYASTATPTNLTFQTEYTNKRGVVSHRSFFGEPKFDQQQMSLDRVVHMGLSPEVDAYPQAAEAIRKAKLILLSCGSLHPSVLSNFLPEGMKAALKEAMSHGAETWLITNLMSNSLEYPDWFTPSDFAQLVENYTEQRLTGVIVPKTTRRKFEGDPKNEEIVDRYALDRQRFLGWENRILYRAEADGLKILQHDATNAVPDNSHSIVRHDPVRMAETVRTLLADIDRRQKMLQ